MGKQIQLIERQQIEVLEQSWGAMSRLLEHMQILMLADPDMAHAILGLAEKRALKVSAASRAAAAHDPLAALSAARPRPAKVHKIRYWPRATRDRK